MTKPTLRRRRFLATFASVGTATFAGCSGGGDGDGGTPTESPTPSPTPTPTTPNEQAVEHYNEAIDALVSIKETLDRWAEPEGFDRDADIRGLRDTLSTANDSLSAAEEAADPNNDLIERIQQATLVATLQEGLIGYFDLLIKFVRAIEDASGFQDNEDHERAAEKWGEAEQLVLDIKSLFDDTKSVHEQINHDLLNEPELDYSDDFTDYLTIDHRQELVTLEPYTNGFEQHNLAFIKLHEGTQDYDNGDWAAAREDWETGRSHLEEARADFQTVVNNEYAPDNIHNTSQGMISVVDGVIQGFDKLIEATHEAEAENYDKAEQLAQEGFEIIGEQF